MADRLEGRFGREHAGAHRQVDALEPHRVDESTGITSDEAAVHVGSRDRVPAALGQRFRAIPDQRTTAQQLGNERMLLEAVERHVRIEERIVVIEADHEAQ